ncbi:uncharacterized protein LOC114265146 [Camellia sinensis]|uniref:uncharacterized protein LOC114265146 n=1 Tax=Camellia sinensis TaxID=4442 RepID=UPI001035B73E|nr:uncharacterized protein LOC114265146 [Camellia sinensis]
MNYAYQGMTRPSKLAAMSDLSLSHEFQGNDTVLFAMIKAHLSLIRDKHLERVLYICLSKDGLYPITVTVMVFPSPDASSIAANVGARVSHPLWCDRTTHALH